MVSRVSIRHGQFSGMPVSETNTQDSIVAVILRVSPTAKVYYDKAFDPDIQRSPTCWSSDTEMPNEDVLKENRQSYRCIDCPQNIKGSAPDGGKQCRFVQLLALVFAEDLSKVYRIQIPSASLFGKTFDGRMPLKEYVKMLDKNEMDSHRIYTRMYFDPTSEAPKVCFAPHEAVRVGELDIVNEVLASNQVFYAIDIDTYVSEAYSGSPFALADGFTIQEESPFGIPDGS